MVGGGLLRARAVILIVLGFFFLGLGAVGLLLPIWPTTPFVLFSAACFSSTPKLKSKIMKIKFFREHIENYESRTGLSRRTVAISLAYLWGMLLISALLIPAIWVKLILAVVGVAVTAHILIMSKAKRADKGSAE